MAAMNGSTGTARRAVNTTDALEWDLRELRYPRRALGLVNGVAARLPFYVPRAGLLLLGWQPVAGGETLRIQPRLDLHCEPWLALPSAAIRPTGAVVHAEVDNGEHILTVQLPARKGRAGARVPLATGLMRLSMQAHDEHLRFLPLVLRSDLGENRRGDPALHLHSLDLAALANRGVPDAALRKQLAADLADRVLGLMALPGAGLARDMPMLLNRHED